MVPMASRSNAGPVPEALGFALLHVTVKGQVNGPVVGQFHRMKGFLVVMPERPVFRKFRCDPHIVLHSPSVGGLD